MQRLYAIAGLSLTAIVLAVPLAITCAPEPVYCGRNVDQWLNAGEEDACHAVHEIGPAALPYIMAKLAREDSFDGTSKKYRQLWSQCPKVVRIVLPKPAGTYFDQTRACTALMELGPKTIPDLAVYLGAKNPAVRSVSAQALGLWRERGKNIERAAQPLHKALIDSDPRVSGVAARALGITPLPTDE